LEIEIGIQPNCSELVARLPAPENLREWRELLSELEQITGWKLGFVENFVKIQDREFDIAVPVEVQKVKVDSWAPYITLRDLPSPTRASELAYSLKYGAGIREVTKHGGWYRLDKHSPKHLPLGLIPYREPIVTQNILYNDEIRIRRTDGYCKIGPVLMAFQHCYTPHFEPLAKVVRSMNTDWHTEDGGSPEDFYEWCRRNKYGDVASKNPRL
jgi:hypothetical protein